MVESKKTSVERISFQSGDILMTQGEIGSYAIVLEAGEVQILVQQGETEKLLALAGAGEIIGEMALIDREARSATVRAITDGEGMIIPWEVFQADLDESPILIRSIVEILARNLRRMSKF